MSKVAQSATSTTFNLLQKFKHPHYGKAKHTFNMLLFGAPGVGKGTYARMIEKDFNFKPFSTGDYFRSITNMCSSKVKDDPLTLSLIQTINSGGLVDDQVVVEIVKNLLYEPDTFMNGEYKDIEGLILDGVPRTVKQAEEIH